MNDSISRLMKTPIILSPGDSAGRAVGLMRASGAASVLAGENGHVLGSVHESDIASMMAHFDNPEDGRSQPVTELIKPLERALTPQTSSSDAIALFSLGSSDVLPVVSSNGIIVGMLHLRDLLGDVTHNMRPQGVAGMATPIGVHLTTGSVSGGAGSTGLFLTGAALAGMIAASVLVGEGFVWMLSALTGVRLDLMAASPPVTAAFDVYSLAFYGKSVLYAVTWLVLMRYSSLSGYHAAEHMTVHAMEVGEELTPEYVRRMPRVHPRCGTNILAAAGIFVIIVGRLGTDLGILVGMIVVIVGWRFVGGMLQQFVTTSNPSEKQLASGVQAGVELIEEYRKQPGYVAVGFQRLWNVGFPQVAAGMFSGYAIIAAIGSLIGMTLWP